MARRMAAVTGIVDCTEQKRPNEAREAGVPWKKGDPTRQGLFLDMPAWGYHVFAVSPAE
jgi:hypothetical protein